MVRRAAAISFSCVILAVTPACNLLATDGGIGNVGDPNKPAAAATNNVVPAATNNIVPIANAPAMYTPPAAAPTGKPLLVIRFNQNHVYFAHPLELAIKSAENAKSGIAYNVVNYVPASYTRAVTDRNNDLASQNLQSVISEMESLGVDGSRITQTTLPTVNGMMTQEVDIFVK